MWIFIILLFVIAIGWWWLYNRNNINNFVNELPKERYPDLVKEFGEPDNTEKGTIYWYNKKGLYNRVVLKDEAIQHCSPTKHYDFLYSTIPVYLPLSTVCQVLSISKSIYYDQLKRELTVRCHFTGANIATIYLALKVATGQLTVDNIKALHSYKQTIMATMDNSAFRDKLESEIRQMQSTLNANAPPVTAC